MLLKITWYTILCFSLGSFQNKGLHRISFLTADAQSTKSSSNQQLKWSDRQILEYLYELTGGSTSWLVTTNWRDPSKDICDWYGVSCVTGINEAYVEEIFLKSNNLIGTVPIDKLLTLPHLKAINLSDNDIHYDFGVSEDNLASAKNLRFVDLSHTSLDGLPPFIAKVMSSVTELSLEGNQISGPFPSSIFQMNRLERLNMNFNSLSGVIPDDLGYTLPQLRYLTLAHNNLKNELPNSLSRLTKLRYLLLQNNELSGIITESLINSMSMIEQLDFSGQKSKEFGNNNDGFSGPLPSMSNLSKLRRVDFSMNSFSGNVPNKLLINVDPDTFEYADLSSNKLSGTISSSLRGLDMHNIFFQDNEISNIDPSLCERSRSDGNALEQREINCDFILCPAGTWHITGREPNFDEPCNICKTANYMGMITCKVDLNYASPTISPTVVDSDSSTTPERSILENLFKTCGGERWTRSQNWVNINAHVCTWTGIACNKNLHVTIVDLSDNNLIGTLYAEQLCHLPLLKTLRLDNNSILFTFDGINKCTALRSIDLSNTGLISLEGIGEATHLKEVYAKSNDLGMSSKPIPPEVFKMEYLEELNLDYNSFRGELPETIGNLHRIRLFSIVSNLLSGEIPTSIGNLTDLVTLRLSENKLSGAIPSNFEVLTKLTVIELFGQKGNRGGFSGILPDFANHSYIALLNLSSNSFEGPIPSNFLASVNPEIFQYADLSDNKLTGTVPISLIPLAGEDFDVKFFLQNNLITGMDSDYCHSGKLAGCNVFLCPPNYFSLSGRQQSKDDDCSLCTSAIYYGTTECLDEGLVKPVSSPMSILSIEPTSSPIDDTDRHILELFFQRCNGPEWVSSNGWLSEFSICTWEGIQCVNGEDRVQSIILKSNNIQSTPPSVLFRLYYLETLVLDGNPIDFSFDGVEEATNLQSLDLSHTNVNVASLASIQNAKNLRDLHLFSSQLSGAFPEELLQLTLIERLSLDFNELTGALPSMSPLRNLQYFSCRNNNFVGTIGPWIGDMTSLLFLMLPNNNLSGSIPDALSQLSQLWFLDISHQNGPGITGHLPSFSNFAQVRRLNLSHNSLSGSIPPNILQSVDTIKFESLDLSSNLITGTIPGILSNISPDSIFVQDNSITAIDQVLCKDPKSADCSQILCPIGTYSTEGKSPCLNCASAIYFGSVECQLNPTTVPPKFPAAVSGKSDREILDMIYDTCGGPRWIEQHNWKDANKSICTWHGIQCVDDESEFVKSIMLSANNLVGTPPYNDMFTLPYLEDLAMSDNSISFSFEGIHQAKMLSSLDMAAVGLSSLAGIGECRTLKDLNLNSNDLRGKIENDIFELDNLEELTLDFNHFSGSLPSGIGNLKNLRLFSCADSDLSGQLPSSISKVSNLVTLRLPSNSFEGTLPPELGTMSNLSVLDLSKQKSAGISGPLINFSDLSAIRKIDLSENSLTGTIPKTMLSNSIPSLIEVADFSFNQLSGSVPASLGPIIDVCYLEGNYITGIDDTLCERSVGDSVEQFGCDAILCAPGSYNPLGRQTSTANKCMICPTTTNFFGSIVCEHILSTSLDDDDKKNLLSGTSFEWQILKLFYDSCDGYHWHYSDGWLEENSSFCNWEGITCVTSSAEESVFSINLGANNLVGTPPMELFLLPSLSSLSLYSNPIDFSFKGIEKAKRLTHLFLDATTLISIDGIGKAPSLKEAHLRFNSLERIDEIYQLSQLTYASMSNNKIVNIPTNLSDLSELKVLLLKENQIRVTLDEMVFPSSLRMLDLSSNHITGTIPSSFLNTIPTNGDMIVDLSENLLRGIIPATLARFERLELYLRNNYFDGIPAELCMKTNWNGGSVKSFGCDGILCPKYTYAILGRQATDHDSCQPCKTAVYLGSSQCFSEEYNNIDQEKALPSFHNEVAITGAVIFSLILAIFIWSAFADKT
mmetsp:Transcript_2044/g.2374  ORF Transcript_2044/g.2374 Transcript_2044/m.2374 type:complete len:1925 (-) Transcript_2044:293-6067(-)